MEITKKQRFLSLFILTTLVIGLTGVASITSAATLSPACSDLAGNLKLGATDYVKNGSVRQLQSFLQVQGYFQSRATGYFGPVTLKAVKNFQKSVGVDTTGFVGPLTRAAIKNMSCVTAENMLVKNQIVTNTSQQASVVQAVSANPSPKVKLPYVAETFPAWKPTWGSVKVTPTGTLFLKPTEKAAGAEAVFPDSSDWVNYRFNANVVVRNSNVTLISRYKDADNFLGCTFFGRDITIVERVNGETKSVASVSLSELPPTTSFFASNMSVSMRVKDKTVGCSVLGVADDVTYTNVNENLLRGGIGIETWTPHGLADPSLELRSVKVEAL